MLPYLREEEWKASIKRASDRKKKETAAKMTQAGAAALTARTGATESERIYKPGGWKQQEVGAARISAEAAKAQAEAYKAFAETDRLEYGAKEKRRLFEEDVFKKRGVMPKHITKPTDDRAEIRRLMEEEEGMPTAAKPNIVPCPPGTVRDKKGNCVKKSILGVYPGE